MRRFTPSAIAAILGLTFAPALHAGIRLNITIDDPRHAHPDLHRLIRSNLHAAAAQWSRYLAGDAAIELKVSLKPGGRALTANGSSETNSEIGLDGPSTVYEEGVASEISTRRDPNGRNIDATITIYDYYLRKELWFDPEPFSRSTPKPEFRTDAVSVMMHELGHCLGWNGWQTPGWRPSLPYQSIFDTYLSFAGDNFYFRGYQSTRIHGGLVPINRRQPHLGNNPPRPGSQYETSIMFGGYSIRDRREITPLDLAVLADLGLRTTALGKQFLVAAGGVSETPWEARGLAYDWFGYFSAYQWPRIRHGILGRAIVDEARSGRMTEIRLTNSKVSRIRVKRSRWPWVYAESHDRDLPAGAGSRSESMREASASSRPGPDGPSAIARSSESALRCQHPMEGGNDRPDRVAAPPA